jgi:hypothetical protein
MSVRVKKSVFVVLMLSMPFGYAKNIDNANIPCPSIAIIQAAAQKLDTAIKLNNKYITYSATSIYQANDLWWFAGVGDIIAHSSDEAIKTGKSFLNKVTIQLDKYATKVGDEFICKYGPGYIEARGKNLMS